MVYIIQFTKSGIIKIGFSMGMMRRINDLKNKSGQRAKLLGYIPGDRKKERQVQERFVSFAVPERYTDPRKSPEYFYPHPDLLVFVRSSEVDKFNCDYINQELAHLWRKVRRGRVPEDEAGKMRQKHYAGFTVRQIAIEHNCSDKWVERALAGFPESRKRYRELGLLVNDRLLW